MVDDVPGWSPVDQLYTLYLLVMLTGGLEGDIVEIGSWCGRSSVILGHAAKVVGSGRVYCIDLFPEKSDWLQNEDGSYSFELQIRGSTFSGYRQQTVWQEPFERDIAPLYAENPSILDRFVKNVNQQNVDDVIQIHRGDSTTFLTSLTQEFQCRLAFLDGDHSYEAVSRDIENVEQLLVPGGWICFDDAFSSYEGVNEAITERIIGSGLYDVVQKMTRKFVIARRCLD